MPGGENLSSGKVIGGTIGSAVIGGTASVISGGKFANGAKTAAFQFMFNQAAKIINKHKRLRMRVLADAASDPKLTIYLSKDNQQVIMEYERLQTLTVDQNISTYVDDFIGADTFIYQDGLASRDFYLEGFGVVKGGNFNYVSVGMMAAHYGHSLITVPVQAVAWNYLQFFTGGGPHNIGQMGPGSFWAGYGYGYYESNQIKLNRHYYD